MAPFFWIVALWLPVVWVALRLQPDRESRRLMAALVIILLATNSTTSGDVSSITANPLVIERAVRGVLSGIALLLAVPLLIRRVGTLLRLSMPAMLAFSLYLVVAVSSVVYSASLVVTTGKVLEVLVGFIVVVAMLVQPNGFKLLRDALTLTIAMIGVSLGVALFGYLTFPDLFMAIDSRPGFLFPRVLGAPYTHPNTAGVDAAILTIYCAAALYETQSVRARRLYLVGATIGPLAVVLTSTRTGLVILVLGLITLMVVKHSNGLWLAFAPLVMLASFNWNFLANAVTRGQSPELLMSLSGRTVWWSSSINAWAEQPLMGHGFGAGGRFVALERVGAGGVSSVHSGYLEALLGVGLIGFIPLIATVALVLVFCARNLRTDLPMALMAIPLVVATTLSLGVGGWFGNDLAWLMLIGAISDLARSGHGDTISLGSLLPESPKHRRRRSLPVGMP